MHKVITMDPELRATSLPVTPPGLDSVAGPAARGAVEIQLSTTSNQETASSCEDLQDIIGTLLPGQEVLLTIDRAPVASIIPQFSAVGSEQVLVWYNIHPVQFDPSKFSAHLFEAGACATLFNSVEERYGGRFAPGSILQVSDFLITLPDRSMESLSDLTVPFISNELQFDKIIGLKPHNPPETIELTYGEASLFNSIGPRRANDDRVALSRDISSGHPVDILAVLDGTGPQGGVASDRIIRLLAENITETNYDMKKAISRVSQRLEESPGGITEGSGAAIAVATIETSDDKTNVTITSLGDCRVVIFDRKGETYQLVFKNSRHNLKELLAEQGLSNETILSLLGKIGSPGTPNARAAFTECDESKFTHIPEAAWTEIDKLLKDYNDAEYVLKRLSCLLIRMVGPFAHRYYSSPDDPEVISVNPGAIIAMFSDGADVVSSEQLLSLCAGSVQEISSHVFSAVAAKIEEGSARDNFSGIIYRVGH